MGGAIMEWKLFEGDHSEFATLEWYEDREAAHHLEEPGHEARLMTAALKIKILHTTGNIETVSDMGCGDGGLLEVLSQSSEDLRAWGYDACPNNVAWAVTERKQDVRLTDFGADETIEFGDCAVYTEVLEHLIDPHGTVRDCPSKYIVASSPWDETDQSHYEFHLWAWDQEGFRKLFEQGGYRVLNQEIVGPAQIIVGVRG